MPKRKLIPSIPNEILQRKETSSNSPFLSLLYPENKKEKFTYSEVFRLAINWKSFYQKKNLSPFDRIVIALPHSSRLYTSYLGAVLGGYIPTMFPLPSKKLSEESYFSTLKELIENASPQMMLIPEEFTEKVYSFFKKRNIFLPNICSEKDASNNALHSTDVVSIKDPKREAFLQYSSGTTGLKKGVMISHKSLLQQIETYAKAIRLSKQDRIVSWLPLYHDMGLIACFWLPLIKNIPIVAISPFDWARNPLILFEAITKYKSSLSWMPNFAYKHLIRSFPKNKQPLIDLSSMRAFVNCSEVVMDSTHQEFLACFSSWGLKKDALWTSYAMAENTFAVTSGGGDNPIYRDSIDLDKLSKNKQAVPASKKSEKTKTLLSSGKALDKIKISIRDEQGIELPERFEGEIWISSPCLAKGYFNHPQEEIRRNGWYATGDLGYLAQEELFVTGRKKDLIIIGGKNIYPQDIEYLLSKIPEIYPGRLIAIGIENASLGTEDLVILAETKEEDPKKLETAKENIFQTIAKESEANASDVIFLPHMTLKKSSSGKISRKANKEYYKTQIRPSLEKHKTSPISSSPLSLEASIRNALKKALSPKKSLEVDTFSSNQELISSGVIDSLSYVALLLSLESEFSISIPNEMQGNMERFETIQEIGKTIEKIKNAKKLSKENAWWNEGYTSLRDTKCINFINSSKDYDMLILGSSRVYAMNAYSMKLYNYRCYNFSVNSAQMEDSYCIYRFVLDRNKTPLKRLLLGLDIDAFNNNYSPTGFLLRSPFLQTYLDKNDSSPIGRFYSGERLLDKKLDGIDRSMHDRFRRLLLKLRMESYEKKELLDEGKYSFDSENGDMNWNWEGEDAASFKKRKPLDLPDPKIPRGREKLKMLKFSALLQKRLEYLLKIIHLCFENGTEVACFLTPIHPKLESFLVKETPYLARINDLKRFIFECFGSKLDFFDCSTPKNFGGSDLDFWDSGHMGAYNADILSRYLLEKEYRKNIQKMFFPSTTSQNFPNF